MQLSNQAETRASSIHLGEDGLSLGERIESTIGTPGVATENDPEANLLVEDTANLVIFDTPQEDDEANEPLPHRHRGHRRYPRFDHHGRRGGAPDPEVHHTHHRHGGGRPDPRMYMGLPPFDQSAGPFRPMNDFMHQGPDAMPSPFAGEFDGPSLSTGPFGQYMPNPRDMMIRYQRHMFRMQKHMHDRRGHDHGKSRHHRHYSPSGRRSHHNDPHERSQREFHRDCKGRSRNPTNGKGHQHRSQRGVSDHGVAPQAINVERAGCDNDTQEKTSPDDETATLSASDFTSEAEPQWKSESESDSTLSLPSESEEGLHYDHHRPAHHFGHGSFHHFMRGGLGGGRGGMRGMWMGRMGGMGRGPIPAPPLHNMGGAGGPPPPPFHPGRSAESADHLHGPHPFQGLGSPFPGLDPFERMGPAHLPPHPPFHGPYGSREDYHRGPFEFPGLHGSMGFGRRGGFGGHPPRASPAYAGFTM